MLTTPVPRAIPRATWLCARKLYLVQGQNPTQIARTLQLTPDQVSRMVRRGGWSSLRDKLNTQLVAASDQNARKEAEKVQEIAAVQAEELLIRSLEWCSDAVDTRNARDFRLITGGIRDLHTLGRVARGMDTAAVVTTHNVTLATFVARGERVVSDPRDVI